MVIMFLLVSVSVCVCLSVTKIQNEIPKLDTDISTLTTQHWAWCTKHSMEGSLICLHLSTKGPSSLTLNFIMSKMAEWIATMACDQYILPTWVRILTLEKYFFNFFWMYWGQLWSEFYPLKLFEGYLRSGKRFVVFILLQLLFLTQQNGTFQ